MRAVRFERDGTVKFVQVPNPQPGPEEVLVQVLAAGVCHTDLHLLDEVKAGAREPLIPGHEIVGRVSKIGEDVDRKSTRLNSSHSQISYAVFCLKKKKQSR